MARSLALNHGAAYGEAFADVYDRWYHQVTDSEATAEFVARRSPSGLVIELGVGTGRLARPLVDRGLTVVGIDTSGPMLDGCPSSVLRIRADMTLLPLVPTRGTGALQATALCGFNTVFNLHTAEAQISLFQQLAPLADIVIVETLKADLLADAPARSTGVGHILPDGVVVSSTVGQRADQRLIGRHLEILDGGVRVRPWMLRWVTVDQLDAMAARADYLCCERWGSWTEEAFEARSRASISVYRRTESR